ncbi:uncharacterized protein LOC115563278 isoform X3 [Drosophila navojoa]|uniref:uncharacterized protein LOC115563278 isoform X3 n=1 Tax=Drosophila navojoa TaxID=7232 RepID=UPI0011BDA0CD|nr:uncharacterized protein LOC115563278 isoform X3 [Drosophila navojoa]
MGDSAILLAQKSFLRGPVTNNGFVNFMRDYAAQARGLDVPDAITVGKMWNRLTPSQRRNYRFMNVDCEDGNESSKESENGSDKASENEDEDMDDVDG